ncbi:MAG: EscU/YscU/HrcU family type III secretion system export apparatus switch protein [Lawsonibacter sp.]|nr:EscU/YscU/HrcU family type III secretion system export apparatus switch protein [Lawsonibacter sp.]
MSKSDQMAGKAPSRRAVALQYGAGDTAPVIVASGMGYLAEKIVSVAVEHDVPVYEDDSLATILTQFQLGQELPEEMYQAIVEIYVYFLNFDPQHRGRRDSSGGGGVQEWADTPKTE